MTGADRTRSAGYGALALKVAASLIVVGSALAVPSLALEDDTGVKPVLVIAPSAGRVTVPSAGRSVPAGPPRTTPSVTSSTAAPQGTIVIATAPLPSTQTFVFVGGSLTVAVTEDVVSVSSIEPAEGFRAEVMSQDQSAVTVAFVGATGREEITVAVGPDGRAMATVNPPPAGS